MFPLSGTGRWRSPGAAGHSRIAKPAMRRVRDFAQVTAGGVITRHVADRALQALEIDQLGLDNIDRRMLTSIIENYAGGPVGWTPWPPPSTRSPSPWRTCTSLISCSWGFSPGRPGAGVPLGRPMSIWDFRCLEERKWNS